MFSSKFFNVRRFRKFVLGSMSYRHASTTVQTLKYKKYGKPSEVLELVEDCMPSPMANEILVKILAAPINPADINTIQGK